MKQIHLFRHSKSDWETGFKSDHGRVLSKKGKKNAQSLRKYLEKIEFKIDLFLVSNSKRTVDTYKIITKSGALSSETKITEKLYESDSEDILTMIRGLNLKFKDVALLGHNPGIEEIANRLIRGNEDLSFSESMFFKFPTSGFLSIRIETESWKELGKVPGKIIRFWIPG
ncbi:MULTISPECIES: SixA phosphatase family protein [Leptospira]|uniref:Phosphohistidine phosphatase SixA n=3 Tax=Leptospira borgpetersenii TaxID=174 RepID=A0AAV3JCN0_LEPBO|nr:MULTISPECIES: histidine phosphatase family protein [Leptospira]EMO11921.1 putative phosphohistidine phosphatase SixA [Leptospira borgpetersenii str. Noumea 25]ALO28086.1 putative phosphohistidine phosphatase SixA [Leptospira borgpetersenii serovar Ballum]ANH02232.1 Putative phosphohistidine phosphatase SixA [Leptospira borgpetersenii str. 4E]AXX16990.1 phosphohistidine phosphatase [Leptospira borgpetersenii serovar Ceylonica]EKQ93806.1 putative phosphohistidine phosphatase SixA [Leptospira 